MKKISFTMLTVLLSLPIFGQMNDKDSLNLILKEKKPNINLTTDQYLPLQKRSNLDMDISFSDPSLSATHNEVSNGIDKKVNMDVSIPQYYQVPAHDYLSNSRNPFADDYRFDGYHNITDRSWLETTSLHETYLMVGSLSKIGGKYNYMVNNNLTLSLGTYTSRYMVNSTSYGDAGINAALRFKVNDRITIHGYGQYSGFANRNRFDSNQFSGMYPQTNYGGAFEYKVNNWLGIMGGMNRELNPMTGKWKNIPYLIPVFYTK